MIVPGKRNRRAVAERNREVDGFPNQIPFVGRKDEYAIACSFRQPLESQRKPIAAKRLDLLLHLLVFPKELRNSLDKLVLLYRKQVRQPKRLFISPAVVGERPLSAKDVQTDSALITHKVKKLDLTDLPCFCNVRCAASTDIDVSDSNDPYVLSQIKLASIVQSGKLSRARIANTHILVFPNCAIGKLFNLIELLARQLSVEIQRDVPVTEVEADVFISVQTVDDPRHDMLSGMVLHSEEPKIKIDLPTYSLSKRERSPYGMNDLAML